MMTVNEVSDWVTDAKKGEEAIYYTGWLANDRGHDGSQLSTLANYVWALMEKKLVSLVQRRTADCTRSNPDYEYVMQRTKSDRI